MANNKVKYGLKNVYYAVATIDTTDNSATYETPVRWPGAVNLSMEAQGDSSKFFADDGVYFSVFANNGYEGDLESALVPESFKKDVLGETEDGNGVVVDNTDAKPVQFALLFEFQGDQNAKRHVLYNCTASRPSIESSTKSESIEVKTETVTITAAAIYDKTLKQNLTKACVTADKTEQYDAWFTAVYKPAAV